MGFGASAFVTLALCTAYYFIDDNATTKLVDKRNLSNDETLRGRTNPVDEILRKKVARLLSSIGDLDSKSWSEAFQKAVLTFSDQQSIIGIAILVSGFSQLGCSLSSYHWQLTFDLAWFSSMTHLTTLTSLRHYFQKRPALRAWRMICMAITAIMLGVSLGSTGYIGQDTDPSFPALCLFRPNKSASAKGKGSYNGWYIGVTSSFLVFSYLSRVIQLLPATMDTAHDWFRVRPRQRFQAWLQSVNYRETRSTSNVSKALLATLHRLIRSTWCILEAMADLWSSLLWEVGLDVWFPL